MIILGEGLIVPQIVVKSSPNSVTHRLDKVEHLQDDVSLGSLALLSDTSVLRDKSQKQMNRKKLDNIYLTLTVEF